ncbi:hypothetical protein KSP39_PZI013970 [Platanthera zijinensis]|uniref:Uncharacterized protein n=1 Tax=Platanthera zijinensis TaxID=2320716 RepID=A0AAP0G3F8_9ASPA
MPVLFREKTLSGTTYPRKGFKPTPFRIFHVDFHQSIRWVAILKWSPDSKGISTSAAASVVRIFCKVKRPVWEQLITHNLHQWPKPRLGICSVTAWSLLDDSMDEGFSSAIVVHAGFQFEPTWEALPNASLIRLVLTQRLGRTVVSGLAFPFGKGEISSRIASESFCKASVLRIEQTSVMVVIRFCSRTVPPSPTVRAFGAVGYALDPTDLFSYGVVRPREGNFASIEGRNILRPVGGPVTLKRDLEELQSMGGRSIILLSKNDALLFGIRW